MKDVLTEAAAVPMYARGQILPEDFEALVRAHQKRIYRILLMLLHDADEANNLTQECFLRAYSRRFGFRGDAAPGTWLVRIAINLAHDQLRSRRNSFWKRLLHGKEAEAQSASDQRPSPEDTLLAHERLAAVWAAVGNLPARQRMVFTLRFGEDMPLQEIAAAMKLREGTVKAQLFNAVNAVRRALLS